MAKNSIKWDEMIGKRYKDTRLVPLKYDKSTQKMYCHCDCGKYFWASLFSILNGHTKSCGCLRNKNLRDSVEKNLVDGTNLSFLNSNINSNNKSGVRGVYQTKNGKWRAYISVKGKQYSLGYFDNFDDAVAARKAGEEKYFKPLLNKYKDDKNRK